jgi:negative regulator of flagellin synthesis FlgM
MTRIDGLNNLATSRQGQSQGAEALPSGEDRTEEANKLGRQLDEVRLSNRGRVVADAMRAVHNASDVREAKVATLKAAIANGSYTSNARDIASRLLATGTFGDQ